MNKKVLLLIAAVGIFVIGAGSAYYFYLNNRKSGYFLAMKRGNNYMNTGDYELALENFNKSLQLAYNQNMEMMSKLKIGMVYTALDPEKGIPYLKNISLDESYPPLIRAGAINLVLTTYIGSRDKNFAKKIIFTGDKWQTFLTNDDFSAAIKNASEWSSNIYSTFLAEYRIALWHANQIRDGKISDSQKSNYISVIKDRFNKGNVNLTKSSKKSDPETLAWGYIYKGNISEFLLNYDKQSGIAPRDVVEAYNKAIEILEKNITNVQLEAKIPYPRFYLAAFMARNMVRNDNSTSELILIKEILKPIYDVKNRNYFDRFINSTKNPTNNTTHMIYNDIIRLATIDPLFKDYLTAIGWEEF